MSEMSSILIKDGLIVTALETMRADILISRGIVAQIGEKLEHSGATVIDASGCFVMPGGVDVHTHLNLSANGVKVGDGFSTGTASAAFGGTTCVVEHPGFGPNGCSLLHQVERYLEEAHGQALVDYGFHAVFQRVDDTILVELPQLAEKVIPTAKVYLTYDGRLNDGEILQVLDRAGSLGLLAAFHAENDAIIAFLRDKFRVEGKLSPLYHALSRPDYCEAEAIRRILCLA
jgi:dihydropyrimidinase